MIIMKFNATNTGWAQAYGVISTLAHPFRSSALHSYGVRPYFSVTSAYHKTGRNTKQRVISGNPKKFPLFSFDEMAPLWFFDAFSN
jgi:hypothetical protein